MEQVKVAVIAASGRSGSAFVRAALRSGMNVRAGVHGKNNFISDKKLLVVECDALNQKSVENLVLGCNVVVSLIGHGKNSPARLQTLATENILSAMQTHSIQRFISLTGTGVRFHNDHPSSIDKLANKFIATVDPERVSDGIEHAELLKSSQIDWTILRVLKLSNLPHTKSSVKMNLDGPAELLTSRHRVATAIIQLIQENSFIRQAPIILKGTNNGITR